MSAEYGQSLYDIPRRRPSQEFQKMDPILEDDNDSDDSNDSEKENYQK